MLPVDERAVPVRVSWEQSYDACGAAAAAVLRALAVLDLATVTSPAVAAAAGLTPAESSAALADLEQDGWLTPGHALNARARTWLTRELTARVEPEPIIRAFAEAHTASAADGWVAAHHGEILAALRACDRPGCRRVGVGLALAVWPAAEPPWWAELAGLGEALAIAERDPQLLADLLHRSATRFAGRGERVRAEEQWVRALAIVRRAAKADRAEAILAGMSTLYRDWGRLGKALDADLGLVDLRREAGDPVGIAEALATVADTMRLAGRIRSAADYLAQADAVITGAGDPLPHARIVAAWGRALWELGEPGPARRQWSRALAMLIDVDDEAADAVRALLATEPEEPLPNDYPGVPNTSSSASGGSG
jgi:tetratricopeptide (TPR) repeat protein